MAHTSCTVKGLLKVSRVVAGVIMTSDDNFCFSEIILRGLILKSLYKCITNISRFDVFIIAPDPTSCFVICGIVSAFLYGDRDHWMQQKGLIYLEIFVFPCFFQVQQIFKYFDNTN